MNTLLYPDASRSAELMNELNAVFSQLPYVRQVMVFGSVVRNEQDRWSDLDMIVVTNRQQDFMNVYEALRKHKPIVHHNPLTPQIEPCGGHLLGVVFENESVFHNLDLNFLSASDYQSANGLQRFGPVRKLYEANKQQTAVDDHAVVTRLAEQPDEIRIGNALHWMKKAVKKVLRHRGTLDAVKACREALKQVMVDYSHDVILPNGNISRVAQTYIEIADLLLNQARGTTL